MGGTVSFLLAIVTWSNMSNQIFEKERSYYKVVMIVGLMHVVDCKIFMISFYSKVWLLYL